MTTDTVVVQDYGLCLNTECKNNTKLTTKFEKNKNINCYNCKAEICKINKSGKIIYVTDNLSENNVKIYNCKKCGQNYCFNCTNQEYTEYIKLFRYWYLGITTDK